MKTGQKSAARIVTAEIACTSARLFYTLCACAYININYLAFAVRAIFFFYTLHILYFIYLYQYDYKHKKLLPWTVDHLARGSMKNAVNCAS